MKKLTGFVVLFLLLSVNVSAEVKSLPEDTTVNKLIKQGYKLYDTDSSAWISKDDYPFVVTFYHLTKNNELVTCSLGKYYFADKFQKTFCWRP